MGGLHRTLQTVMGWENCHLHEFLIGRRIYSVPDPDDAMYERKVIDERRGPPEDVGGPPGYQDYLEALANPKHEEHKNWLQWRARFDSEAFSLATVNEQLRKELRVTPRQKTVRNARNTR